MLTMACVGSTNFLGCLPKDAFAVVAVAQNALKCRTWEGIRAVCGRSPDIVAYFDYSAPPPLPGVEHFPCLTVFGCVDSHIHHWYPTYAQAFDLCTVSLRDHLPAFQENLSPDRAIWLPPAAEAMVAEAMPREEDKDIDLLFVGKVDADLTPGRAALLGQLAALFPGLVVTRGNWRELFPRARLVLNIAEHGDLNFRVFEALSVGSCLLTPEVGHGLTELFSPGEHLFTYPPGDLDRLAALVRELLPDPARRERVARQGLEALRARHGPAARAERFAGFVTAQPAEALVRRRLEASRELPASLRLLYLHWAEALPGDPRAALYLEAAKGRLPAGSHGL